MSKKIAKLEHVIPQQVNANVHTPAGMGLLEGAIARDGWIGAITVAADGETFDGSARREVLETAGLDDPIVVETDGRRPVVLVRTDIPSASDPRARRLAIEANQIAARNLAWDAGILAQLAATDPAIPDLWPAEDWAALLAQMDPPDIGGAGDDFDPTPADGPTRTQAGDLWLIDGGRHRLLVGDCTDPANVERLMGGERAVLMVTDPPYGVEYDPSWRVAAGIQERSFNSGKVKNDDRVDWREAWLLFAGDVVYCWHAGRHASSVQASLEAADFDIRAQIIWNKDLAVFGRGDYHWKHEPCWYAVRKGKSGNRTDDRKQSTVWDIPTIHSFVNGHNAEDWGLTGHGTQKPIECMARPMQNHGKMGDIVYDPFLGSGTTLIAAHQTGRRCYGMEISERYADVILRRAEAAGLPCARAEP